MNNKNKPFQATEYSKKIDTNREVISYVGDMAICLDDGIVIITKQQAMDFWGLVNQGVNIKSDDSDQDKCPAINEYCRYYFYQHDDSIHDPTIYCGHKDNTNKLDGNCTRDLCPILVKNN